MRAARRIAPVAGLLLGLAVAAPLTVPAPAHAESNSEATDRVALDGLRLPDLEGRSVALASYLGKGPVVLDFWATWCKPCLAALPELQQLYTDLAPRGLQLVGINEDGQRNAAKVKPFAKTQGMTFPVLLDLNREAQTRLERARVADDALARRRRPRRVHELRIPTRRDRGAARQDRGAAGRRTRQVTAVHRTAGGERRRARSSLPLLAAAFSTLAAAFAVGAPPATAQIAIGNLLETRLGRDPESARFLPPALQPSASRFSTFEQLRFEWSHAPVRLGFRYETYVASDTLVPEYGRFVRRWAAWSTPRFEALIGNYDAMFGRGLVLRAFELPGVVREEFGTPQFGDSRDLDGVRLRWQDTHFDVLALQGKPRFADDPPTRPRRGSVEGASAAVSPTPACALVAITCGSIRRPTNRVRATRPPAPSCRSASIAGSSAAALQACPPTPTSNTTTSAASPCRRW
jgi:thiol-disulfide isomerase/thioredoxin